MKLLPVHSAEASALGWIPPRIPPKIEFSYQWLVVRILADLTGLGSLCDGFSFKLISCGDGLAVFPRTPLTYSPIILPNNSTSAQTTSGYS